MKIWPHLKQNLQNTTCDSERSRENDEERNYQLNKVICERFKLVENFWRLMHKVTHGIWHWLSL